MEQKEGIVIIGGGLGGLTLAYLLSKRNVRTTVLEAAPRLGGRIHTVEGTLGTPLELGATWLSDMHTNLINLLEELGLNKYPQYSKGISLFQTKSFEPPQKFDVPESENPSYRIAGGTQELINALAQKLPTNSIHLKNKVTSIVEEKDYLIIETTKGHKYFSTMAVLCMPPQLIENQISFLPELPVSLTNILSKVHTWMGGALKFALEYDRPFWKDNGYSGMLFSHSGIITEMYDHTNSEESKFGFTGFLNGSAASYLPNVRKENVVLQLTNLLGSQASNPVSYFDKIWTDEFILGGSQIIQRPHQCNGHPLLLEHYLKDKLLFCATETATEYAGYMEGAVVAAQRAAAQIV